MIADEVQTGIGRTGKLLAGEHFGCKADVTTLAKGLAGGLPIGACLANEKCADVLDKGSHGSTFGGNPVSCAGAVKVLEKMSQAGMMESITEKSDYIRQQLSTLEEVAELSGKGMMIGIALKTKKAPDVLQECLKNGLLVLTAKDRVRLLPPLNIGMEELQEGMRILCNVLEG